MNRAVSVGGVGRMSSSRSVIAATSWRAVSRSTLSSLKSINPYSTGRLDVVPFVTSMHVSPTTMVRDQQ